MRTTLVIVALMAVAHKAPTLVNAQSPQSYTTESLLWDDVEISNVLLSNDIFTTPDPNDPDGFQVNDFTISIPCFSSVVEEIICKIFVGERLDSLGNLLSITSEWMNFVELDSFNYNIVSGDNTIQRSSNQMPQPVKIPRGNSNGNAVRFVVLIIPKSWNKPFGFPFDAPVSGFSVPPNMFFKNAEIFDGSSM